jgi:hypothetical protein
LKVVRFRFHPKWCYNCCMHPHTQKLLLGAATLLALGGALGGWAARGPDFQVQFEREVITSTPPEPLKKAVHNLINWSEWHFNTREVLAIDLTGLAYPPKAQVLMKGALIEFSMEPPKKEWKRFVIKAVATEYSPGQILSVRLLDESKGRISQLVAHLQWTIEFLPSPSGVGTLIRGRATALTQSPRARFFGRLFPRILMNQLFYPDLERLARLEFPKDTVSP